MATIEIKKVASVNEAIAIISRLNYMNCTFEYANTNHWSDDHNIECRHFETDKSFSVVEIVKNGKLTAVRFYNHYRDIIVELQFGDTELDYSNFDNIIIVGGADNIDAEQAQADNNSDSEEETKMTYKTQRGKGYAINRKTNEDSPLYQNHVDLFIDENDTLSIEVFFHCKNLETAYKRFIKTMEQVAADHPEFKGWEDCWTPANKITQAESGVWYNENDDVIFFPFGQDCHGCLILDDDFEYDESTNRYYFFGKFPNAGIITPPEANVYDYLVTADAQQAAIDAEQQLADCNCDSLHADIAKFQAAFDNARERGDWLKINGEYVSFWGDKVCCIRSDRFDAYIDYIYSYNGKKSRRFNYRGALVKKDKFFECIANEERASEQLAAFRHFDKENNTDRHSDYNACPSFKFCVIIYYIFANGKESASALYYDSFDQALAYLHNFKAFAATEQLIFRAKIQEKRICGKVFFEIYNDGREIFTDEYYTDIANHEPTEQKNTDNITSEQKREYKYYVTSNLPIADASPAGFIKAVDDINKFVIYDHPLTISQVVGYYLVRDINNNESCYELDDWDCSSAEEYLADWRKRRALDLEHITRITVDIETDGSEDDSDNNSVFDLLPNLDELNDIELEDQPEPEANIQSEIDALTEQLRNYGEDLANLYPIISNLKQTLTECEKGLKRYPKPEGFSPYIKASGRAFYLRQLEILPDTIELFEERRDYLEEQCEGLSVKIRQLKAIDATNRARLSISTNNDTRAIYTTEIRAKATA